MSECFLNVLGPFAVILSVRCSGMQFPFFFIPWRRSGSFDTRVASVAFVTDGSPLVVSDPSVCKHRTTLGVVLDIPCEVADIARRDKLAAFSGKFLRAGSLSPTDAGSLAGRATFFDSSCMGRVGRAATKLLYARQHMDSKWSTSIAPTIRASLSTFNHIVLVAAPQSLPVT